MRNLFLIVALLLFSTAANAYDKNFFPIETVTLTAGTSSTSVQFTSTQTGNTQELMVVNTGSTIAFLVCGGAGAIASVPGDTVSWPVIPNGALLVNKGNAAYCAAITASGSDVLYLTQGAGN